jgi:hypothetical protein
VNETALDQVARLASEIASIRRAVLDLSKNKQLEPEVRCSLVRAASSLAQADAEVSEYLGGRS